MQFMFWDCNFQLGTHLIFKLNRVACANVVYYTHISLMTYFGMATLQTAVPDFPKGAVWLQKSFSWQQIGKLPPTNWAAGQLQQ